MALPRGAEFFNKNQHLSWSLGNFERIGIQCFSGDLPKLDDEFQGAPRGRAQGHAPPDATNERPAERGSARGSDFDDGSAQSTFENYHDVVDATSSIARQFAADKFRWLETIARDASLPSTATRVAVVVGKHLNRHTRSARPSIERLTRELNLSETTVRSALRKLQSAGHLQISEGGGRGLANVYRMVLSPIHKPSEKAECLETETPPKYEPYPIKTPPKSAEKRCDSPHPNNEREQFKTSPIARSPSTSGRGGEVGKDFHEFWVDWGEHAAGASRPKAIDAWSILSDADRAAARECVGRYLNDCRAKTRKICHPSTFLTERRWESYRSAAPAIRRIKDPLTCAVDEALNPNADRTTWVFVDVASPGARPWLRAFARVPRSLPDAREHDVKDINGCISRRRGWYFPSEFPPSPVLTS